MAHLAGEPVRFLNRPFWTLGVLHLLGLDAPVTETTVEPPDLAALHQWLRAGLDDAVTRRGTAPYITAEITAVITDLVRQWGQQGRTGSWQSFVELATPFIPANGRLCARIDVVLTRGDAPDLVVEIDSAHNSRSVEKLRFAHSAGATAIWIRWHSGACRSVPGVEVIDLLAGSDRSVQHRRAIARNRH